MLEYCIIRSGRRSFPSTFFTVYEFLFFVISISVYCKTEEWMYICLDNNQYFCFVLYFPIEAEREDDWVLHHPVRLVEFSVNFFYSVWIKNLKKNYMLAYGFLFFVTSISVGSKTEVWMYICIDSQYYVAVLYLPGGWKGGLWCSQPRLFHVRKDSKSYASSFVVLNYTTLK